MKQIFTIILSLMFLSSHSQVLTQKGSVVELNSGKKSIPGVAIAFYGAISTDTDDNGTFNLSFKNKKYGNSIIYQEIYKKGYEIVNEKELQIAKLSNQKLKIILCKAGLISQKQLEYYNISKKAITAGHERRIKALRKQLGEAKIAEEQFVMQQRKLMEEKEAAIKYANELSEQFARTNFDDVSDLYKRAFEQFKLGNIDKAIDILNEKDLISAANNLIKDKKTTDSLKTVIATREQDNLLRRDTLMQTIQLKAELLVMQFEYEKADTLYQQLWLLDTTHVENTSKYANFLRERKQYDKALLFYDKLLKMEIEEWRKGNTYKSKSAIYREIGKYTEALTAQKESYKIFDKLYTNNKNNAFYMESLAISYSRLGLIYESLGNIEEALKYYTLEIDISKRQYDSKPKNEGLKNGLAISYQNLGNIYYTKGDFSNAIEYYTLFNNLEKELYESNPKSENIKSVLAISYSKLGGIYKVQGKLVKALEYYTLYNQLSKELYNDNPKSANLKNGLATSYAYLGIIYYSQRNFVKALEYHTLYNKLEKELYESNPQSEDIKRNLAISNERLAMIYEAQGNLVKALEYYSQQTVLFKELSETNPKSISLKNSLAISYERLGSVSKSQRNFEKALEYYSLYNKLGKELSEQNPQNEKFKDNLAISYSKLGEIYINLVYQNNEKYSKDDYKIIKETFKESFRIQRELANKNPRVYEIILGYSCNSIGLNFINIRAYNESLSYLSKSIEIYKKYFKKYPDYYRNMFAYILNNRGYVYTKLGKHSLAKENIEKSENLKPDNAWVYRNWACYYSVLNKQEEALANLEKAIQMKFTNIYWIENEELLNNIRNTEKYKSLIESLKK